MITLTNPFEVSTVLGTPQTQWTPYDRMSITTLNYDVMNQSISGSCQIIASSMPNSWPIQGSYVIPSSGQAILTVSIPALPYFASIALTSAQQATVQSWVTLAQNRVEGGLINFGVVAGVQAPGS